MTPRLHGSTNAVPLRPSQEYRAARQLLSGVRPANDGRRSSAARAVRAAASWAWFTPHVPDGIVVTLGPRWLPITSRRCCSGTYSRAPKISGGVRLSCQASDHGVYGRPSSECYRNGYTLELLPLELHRDAKSPRLQ